MKIKSVDISNFKAIDHVKLDLNPTFNVVVGANGSGKSSVLQALHWMFQSGRNHSVAPNKENKASTLSEKNAIFMPSPDYRRAGHRCEYGNTHEIPQLSLEVVAEVGGKIETAAMWLKAARNEGISVHIPSGNPLVTKLRDQSREFSAYIPGVAGIPLVEEKRSKLLVHRSAAAGDANTVLRNMLFLLSRTQVDNHNGLEVVAGLVSQVMGPFTLKVEFDEERHTRVMAMFKTDAMAGQDNDGFRPLELAGIGYLQVLQIFCYLVYFKPVLLLIDEPDAHLYPIAQEHLVQTLYQAAEDYDCQVLMTTHSPSIVRSLPRDSKVIWMRDGKVQSNGDTEGRQLMGWGLLDRKILLLTEDENTDMLRSIVAQWPDIERVTAIWSLYGSSNTPSAEAVSGLKTLLGPDISLVIHRDRDFLMPEEVKDLVRPYITKGVHFWVTKHSDIEAYWTTEEAIAAHFNLTPEKASALLTQAVNEAKLDKKHLQSMRRKRNEVTMKRNRDGALPNYSDEDVLNEFEADGEQFSVLGKTLMKRIRDTAQNNKLNADSAFGDVVPIKMSSPLADDLRVLLTQCL